MNPFTQVARFSHDHQFLGASHDESARRALWVVALIFVMMLGEIAAGYLTGSMALLADGFHMVTHAGALVIARWAYGLMKSSAAVLLDSTDVQVAAEIRHLVEADGDTRITDLRVWQIGPQARAAIVSVVTRAGVSAESIRERLAGVHELSHLTLEPRSV